MLALAVGACSVRRPAAVPPVVRGKGIVHEVRAGETLYRIGKAYGVSYQAIARANGIRDPAKIEVGQRLVIPGAGAHVPVGLVAPLRASQEPERRDPKAPVFDWPVAGGTVTSGFGPRRGTVHDGIDIGAPVGATVRAAAEGEVVYSAALTGYGNVIIVRHAGGYATVYAHNRENGVSEGQRVKQGEAIAAVGESGRTTGPNLHFEIRRDNVARNPLTYLPIPGTADAGHSAGVAADHRGDARLTTGR